MQLAHDLLHLLRTTREVVLRRVAHRGVLREDPLCDRKLADHLHQAIEAFGADFHRAFARLRRGQHGAQGGGRGDGGGHGLRDLIAWPLRRRAPLHLRMRHRLLQR